MAALDREALYAAIFARLGTVAGVQTLSRTFRDLNQVRQEEQPAVFLTMGDEQAQHQVGQPPRWLLTPSVYVYVRTDPETGSPPSSILNPILTSIEAALSWQAGDGSPAQGSAGRLGGLCTYCRYVGAEVGEGLGDGQALAIVDLEVLVLGAA